MRNSRKALNESVDDSSDAVMRKKHVNSDQARFPNQWHYCGRSCCRARRFCRVIIIDSCKSSRVAFQFEPSNCNRALINSSPKRPAASSIALAIYCACLLSLRERESVRVCVARARGFYVGRKWYTLKLSGGEIGLGKVLLSRSKWWGRGRCWRGVTTQAPSASFMAAQTTWPEWRRRC